MFTDLGYVPDDDTTQPPIDSQSHSDSEDVSHSDHS